MQIRSSAKPVGLVEERSVDRNLRLVAVTAGTTTKQDHGFNSPKHAKSRQHDDTTTRQHAFTPTHQYTNTLHLQYVNPHGPGGVSPSGSSPQKIFLQFLSFSWTWKCDQYRKIQFTFVGKGRRGCVQGDDETFFLGYSYRMPLRT